MRHDNPLHAEPKTVLERFLAKTTVGPVVVPSLGPCLIWTGGTWRHGYGQFNIDKHPIQAHRAGWLLQVGPIPKGLLALHRCDNPPCVRLDHLYLGSPKQNVLDRVERGRDGNASKDFCNAGHPFDEANTYVRPHSDGHGRRDCRRCKRDRQRAYMARRRESA